METLRQNNAAVGIGFILLGMAAISINDMIIKQLSGAYPLHQMVFVRSAIGILFSLVFLRMEGGLSQLRTRRPGLHFLRGCMVIISNLAFFAALAVLPLADTTALFFVAPLFITLLSVPFLGEKVGLRRGLAVTVGFVGVLIMLRPDPEAAETQPAFWVMLLPIVAALTYAVLQVLTRLLGATTKASAMAIYIQAMFILVGIGMWSFAGDGRFAQGRTDEVLIFLLRAWHWPEAADAPWFGLLGLMSAVIGYSLAQAYRMADAATVAPFEYAALPLAVFWGWTMFGDVPDTRVLLGVFLIAGSGIYVFIREQRVAVKRGESRGAGRQ